MLIILVAVCLLALVAASPLDLSFGGVYDSPAAQAYWARRFPWLSSGRASGLRALQEGINAGARARSGGIP